MPGRKTGACRKNPWLTAALRDTAEQLVTWFLSDSNPAATFGYLADRLSALGIAYLHVSEAIAGPAAASASAERLTPHLRKAFGGTLIVNGGYDAASGENALAAGEAELVAYGVPFLTNPDLVERFRRLAPLNAPDYATFYAAEKDESGYIDYPTLTKTEE